MQLILVLDSTSFTCFRVAGFQRGFNPLSLSIRLHRIPSLKSGAARHLGKVSPSSFAFEHIIHICKHPDDSPLLHPLLLRETFLQCEQLLVRLLPQVVKGEGQGGGGEPLHPGQAVPGEPQSVRHAL